MEQSIFAEKGNHEVVTPPATTAPLGENQQPVTPDAEKIWEELLGGGAEMFGTPVEDTKQGTDENQLQQPNKPVTTDQRQQELEERSSRYWQSQKDKVENEKLQLERELKALKEGSVTQLPPRNPQTGQFVSPQVFEQSGVNPLQNSQAPDISFPDPPQKPDRPRSFSRAEAYADDRSESARYLDEMDQWNADIQLYNAQKIDFTQAQQQQALKRQQMEFAQREQARQMQIAQEQQLSGLVTSLRDGYQMNDQQIKEFITEMSNPSSVSLDNLYKVYALNHGIPIGSQPQQVQQPTQQQIPQPSGTFMQQQRAQQAPNPMGVLPVGGNPETSKSPVDLFFDTLLADDKKNDPFG